MIGSLDDQLIRYSSHSCFCMIRFSGGRPFSQKASSRWKNFGTSNERMKDIAHLTHIEFLFVRPPTNECWQEYAEHPMGNVGNDFSSIRMLSSASGHVIIAVVSHKHAETC